MPNYSRIPFDPDEGRWNLLRRSREPFSACEIRRATDENSSERQKIFEALARQLSNHFGDACVPIFLSTPSKGEVRLDCGCVGHAVANEVIWPPKNSDDGYVEWITLREN